LRSASLSWRAVAMMTATRTSRTDQQEVGE
jgi:hypothetical protein